MENKITFAVDAKKNFVYVDTSQEKPRKYFNYKTGEDLGNSGSITDWCLTIISTPDFSIKADPDSFEHGTGRVLHKKAEKQPSKLESQRNLYTGRYDPRKVFFPSDKFTWDSLADLIKRINKYGKMEFDGYRLKMEEHIKGDIIEYKIIESSGASLEKSDPNLYTIITRVFSSQYSFNMVYWEAATGSGTVFQKYTWEYEFIGGIYLPKRVIVKLCSSKGEMTDEYDSTYNNNKVNQEIQPETFEYTNLNLKEGDIFIDKILNKKYQYEAATKTLKPVEKEFK